jgi:hypothetical protein
LKTIWISDFPLCLHNSLILGRLVEGIPH